MYMQLLYPKPYGELLLPSLFKKNAYATQECIYACIQAMYVCNHIMYVCMYVCIIKFYISYNY